MLTRNDAAATRTISVLSETTELREKNILSPAEVPRLSYKVLPFITPQMVITF